MRNLDRSPAGGETFGAMSHDNVASPFAASNYGGDGGRHVRNSGYKFRFSFSTREAKTQLFLGISATNVARNDETEADR